MPLLENAGEAGGARRLAEHPHLEADDVAGDQHPAGGDDGERDQDADVHARAADQDRQLGGILEQPALREIEALADRAADHDQQPAAAPRRRPASG